MIFTQIPVQSNEISCKLVETTRSLVLRIVIFQQKILTIEPHHIWCYQSWFLWWWLVWLVANRHIWLSIGFRCRYSDGKLIFRGNHCDYSQHFRLIQNTNWHIPTIKWANNCWALWATHQTFTAHTAFTSNGFCGKISLSMEYQYQRRHIYTQNQWIRCIIENENWSERKIKQLLRLQTTHKIVNLSVLFVYWLLYIVWVCFLSSTALNPNNRRKQHHGV